MRTLPAVGFLLVLVFALPVTNAVSQAGPNHRDVRSVSSDPGHMADAGANTAPDRIGALGSRPAPPDTTLIPIEFVHHIFLKAEINDLTADLLFDPVQNVILDRTFARRAGLPLVGGREAGYGTEVTMGGAGSEQHVVLFARDVRLRSGVVSREFGLSPTVPLDSMMAGALGRHFDGLFGINLLAEYVVAFDFLDEQLVLHPPDFEPDDAVSIPITWMERRPTIPMQFEVAGEVQTIQCLLDFGMGGTLRFTTRYTDEANLVQRLAPTLEIDSETGMGGGLQSHLTRVDQLSLGGFELDGVVATLARERQGADADRPWEALIGLGVLSRFRIYLDLAHDRIFLQPNERFGLPFEHVDSGITFSPLTSGVDQKLVIESVEETSAAADAGLRAGDVIVLVGGQQAAGWNVRHFDEAIERRVGEEVEVVISRGNERVTTFLTVVGLI